MSNLTKLQLAVLLEEEREHAQVLRSTIEMLKRRIAELEESVEHAHTVIARYEQMWAEDNPDLSKRVMGPLSPLANH